MSALYIANFILPPSPFGEDVNDIGVEFYYTKQQSTKQNTTLRKFYHRIDGPALMLGSPFDNTIEEHYYVCGREFSKQRHSQLVNNRLLYLLKFHKILSTKKQRYKIKDDIIRQYLRQSTGKIPTYTAKEVVDRFFLGLKGINA